MHRLLAACTGAIERAIAIVDRTRGFTLDDLKYGIRRVVPEGAAEDTGGADMEGRGRAVPAIAVSGRRAEAVVRSSTNCR
ncbi:MAG: hypothetical protein R3B68_15385 [Phycisphaerales bacterium]